MKTFRWVDISMNKEVLVDENDEVHATIFVGYRELTTWGERQFLSRAAAKKAVEEAKKVQP